MKRLIKAFAVLLFMVSFPPYAQSQKEVLENCQGDDECKTGKCLVLRSGDKKCSDCDQSQLNDFTSKVDDKCKDLDRGILGYSDLEKEFGSKNEVSLNVLHLRYESCKACYDARSERENKCWKGGDSGHKNQMEELKKSMNYLEGLISEKNRYKLGYNCEPDKYDDLLDDIKDNCKDIDNLFAKYGLNDNQQGSCSELNNLIDKCIDCREAWDDLISNCFRNGASDDRMKRLKEIQDMEKISKETLAAKKGADLCL